MAKWNPLYGLFNWDEEVRIRRDRVWKVLLSLAAVSAVLLFILFFPWPHHIDVSQELLQWENALNGGSTETQWRQVELQGTYYDSILGDDRFETTALSIDGLPVALEGNISSGHSVYNRCVMLQYLSFSVKGIDGQFMGYLYFSKDFRSFLLILPYGELGVENGNPLMCYPAQNREEAVALAREIMGQKQYLPEARWE